MRRLILLAALLAVPAAEAGEIATVCFTPGQDCTGLIVREIAAAKSEVLVQAYSFTSPEIAGALAYAARHGVTVKAIIDPSNLKGKEAGNKGHHAAEALALAGAIVQIDDAHGIAHNKVIVIDRRRVVTGSFNFSRSAQERNAENVVVIDGADVAGRYVTNWWAHAGHASPYPRR